MVQVSPRAYDTPTIPYAGFNVSVSLVTRAEADSKGGNLLSTADVLVGVFHAWQMHFSNVVDALTVEGKFSPQGYSLDGGECGVDRDAGTWTYSHNMTIYGTITE